MARRRKIHNRKAPVRDAKAGALIVPHPRVVRSTRIDGVCHERQDAGCALVLAPVSEAQITCEATHLLNLE